MSQRSQARTLQTLTLWPYQKCLHEVRHAENEARELAENYNWPLKRAIIYLVDNSLDEEYAFAASGLGPVTVERCDNCSCTFFVGYNKHGILITSTQHCPHCVERFGVDLCEKCGKEVISSDNHVCSECWEMVMSDD